jgi:hypothetical protein
MSDFQAQYDSYVKAANDAVILHNAELQASVPGMFPSHFRRLVTNISRLLGFVDRKQAAHPEYLAGTPRNIPERAVEVIAGVPVSFDSGILHFVQNFLPPLVEIEDKLVSAVGGAAFTAEQIRTQQVKAIDKLRIAAHTSYSQASANSTAIAKWKDEIGESVKAIKQAESDSEADRQAVDAIRKQAEKLSRGNASQNPLEKLVQGARERFDELDKSKQTAETAAAQAQASASAAKGSESAAVDTLKSLKATDEKADAILRNATQAGLAGAFKTEREEIRKEQRYFAYTFYGIIGAIVLYALAFLLPIVREALGLNGSTDARESALLLFVRVVILAPVVWALVFTNRRFRYLETLQMDYAAKANTALAFAGYVDEMHDDPELQRELRRGLVRRFVEHPSRLLTKDTGEDDLEPATEVGLNDRRQTTWGRTQEEELNDEE